MESNFLYIKRLLENNKINFANNRMKSVVRDYSYLEVSSVFDYENNHETYQQMEDSNIVIINQYKENGNDYFILGFKQTIIYIKQNSIKFLLSLFLCNKNLTIYFLSNSKESFDKHIQILYKELNYNSIFEEEITNFINRILFIRTNKLVKQILPCIAGYLIRSGYIKSYEDRLYYFIKNNGIQPQEKFFSKDEFVFLRDINASKGTSIQLYYYIEKKRISCNQNSVLGLQLFVRKRN